MIKSYFLTALRNFLRNKVYVLINITGLTLGLATSLLAILFVLDELSFDQFHQKKERLYRLNKIVTEDSGETFLTAETSGLMGPTMVDEFPEVEKVVRIQPWFSDMVISNKEVNYYANSAEVLFVDSTFFDVFDFTLLSGDPKKVLTRPSTIVLTEETAKALFGDEDPIGKSVIGFNALEYEVTGIAKSAPRNSHLQYKALISWSTTVPNVGQAPMNFMNNWLAQALATYILVREGTDIKQLESKFPAFMQTHMPNRVDVYQLYLQPFRELYLLSSDIKSNRMARIGSIQYVYIFSIIAGFLMLIACVNYINIYTSKAAKRAREVGMRKSLGASRWQLVYQFLGESFLITIFSGFLAILVADLFIPIFNELSGKTLEPSLLLDGRIFLGLCALIILVSILSGLYPALILSGFRPSEVLKGAQKSKASTNWPRQILISFQFIISIIMIAGTLLVFEQLKYISSKDLGFNKDQVLVVRLSSDIIQKHDTFENEIKSHPEVANVSVCRSYFGQGNGFSTYVIPEGFKPDEIEARIFSIDRNFKETYDITIKQGRFFHKEVTSDSGSLLINESMVKRLNWADPLNKTIRLNENGPALPVIGVVNDFHFKSLTEALEPMVIYLDFNNFSNMSIRFQGKNTASLLSFLEKKWKEYEPRYPFNYYFVDQEFEKMYKSERRLFKTIITFAIISLLVACLGLYGLVSFIIEQRTKELGIRKVLGASVGGLTFLVNKRFVVMVLISGIIAVPITYKLIDQWLQKFVYHINIPATPFVVAILFTLLITVISVCIQALRAALANPVNALRHE